MYVKIKKGSIERVVSSGSYSNYFRNWKVIEKDVDVTCVKVKRDYLEPEALKKKEGADSKDSWDEVEGKKDINNMSSTELRRYAKELGIDTTGLSSKQIKDTIEVYNK